MLFCLYNTADWLDIVNLDEETQLTYTNPNLTQSLCCYELPQLKINNNQLNRESNYLCQLLISTNFDAWYLFHKNSERAQENKSCNLNYGTV